MEKTFELQRRAKKHIHMYEKRTNKFVSLWMCADPLCTHHVPKHLEITLDGRASLCNECREPIVLDEENMKLDKPICSNCFDKIHGRISSEDIGKYLEEKESMVINKFS